MRRLRPCACIAIAIALVACASSEGSRALHQWTDAAGNVRYTEFPEGIPRAQAHTLERVVAAPIARRSLPPPAEPVDVAAARPPSEPPAAEPPAVEPSAAEPTAAPPPAETPLDLRIAELEERIETEQEALKVLISDPAAAAELRDSPQLREIGERLPALQGELEELRKQRAEQTESDGG